MNEKRQLAKLKRLIYALLFLNVIGSVVIAWLLLKKPSGSRANPDKAIELLKEELDLSEDQVKRISSIQKRIFVEQEQAEAYMRDCQRKVNQNMFDPNIDSLTIRGLMEKVGDAEFEKEWLKYKKFKLIRAELNPEQQVKMTEMMSELERLLTPKPKHRKK